MGDHPRAVVVPFPAVPPRGGREHGSRLPGQGVVVRPWDQADADAGPNEAWDQLLRLVDRAWAWRDPETLSQLEECVVRLGILVEADWS